MSEETVGTSNEPEVEETPLAKAIKVVELARRSDLDEEATLMTLVNSGFGFRKAGRMYDLAMESLGLRMSSKVRYEAVSELLEGEPLELEAWDDVVGCVDFITENVEATSDSQARAALKKFCEEHKIEFPAKPKHVGSLRGESKTSKIRDYVVECPNASDEEVTKKCVELGLDKRQAQTYYVALAHFCRRYHEARIAE